MITYAPKSITDAVKSRPDWPEIETAMKRAYGSNWRLVSCDEPMHPAEAGEMEDSMENEFISRKELIVWLMPYVHTGEKVDPEALIADIRAMKAAEVVSEESLMREMERTGEVSRIAAEFEHRVDELEAELRENDGADAERLREFAEEVIRQFAYRIKTNGQCAYTAGGLSVLEEAFDIIGWDDPHLCPECECEEDGCHEWATGGMLTPDGYKWLCSQCRKKYESNEVPE